jgi:hypothetical protein
MKKLHLRKENVQDRVCWRNSISQHNEPYNPQWRAGTRGYAGILLRPIVIYPRTAFSNNFHQT